MVKQPAMESSEFTMSHEDFPALPGAPPSGAGGGGGVGLAMTNSHDGVTSQSVASLLASATGHGAGGDMAPGAPTGGPINDIQRQQVGQEHSR